MEKINLKGLSLRELQEFAESLGEKPYRGQQLYIWLYGKGAKSFAEMTDISKSFRAILEQRARIDSLEVVKKEQSARDGTTKFLLKLSDGLLIESVLIPPEKPARDSGSRQAGADLPASEKRLTLCVSTQVGCPLDCKFCATGTMGFYRNLTAGEIVDQVIQAQNHAPRRISNVVFMGMGEPMLNYENVMMSVEVLNSEMSFHIGARHITVSTAGYADHIQRMADEERKIKLALSLHSLDNEKRTALMPITKKYSVSSLLDAMEYYYRKTRLRPTFEYILFDGFNDTDQDIQRLIDVSKRFPCKVNVIPYHSIAFTQPDPAGISSKLQPTPGRRVEEFVDTLHGENITVMIRSSAGEDINAACGQLAVQEERNSQRQRQAVLAAVPIHQLTS